MPLLVSAAPIPLSMTEKKTFRANFAPPPCKRKEFGGNRSGTVGDASHRERLLDRGFGVDRLDPRAMPKAREQAAAVGGLRRLAGRVGIARIRQGRAARRFHVQELVRFSQEAARRANPLGLVYLRSGAGIGALHNCYGQGDSAQLGMDRNPRSRCPPCSTILPLSNAIASLCMRLGTLMSRLGGGC